MNGHQALNLKIGDPVIRDGSLGGHVVNKERMFVAIRWDDGTVTSTHRYNMENINRPGVSTAPRTSRISTEEKQQIVEALENGATYKDAADKVGLSFWHVRNVGIENGRSVRKRPRATAEQIVKIATALEKGATYREAAEITGVSESTVGYLQQKYKLHSINPSTRLPWARSRLIQRIKDDKYIYLKHLGVTKAYVQWLKKQIKGR